MLKTSSFNAGMLEDPTILSGTLRSALDVFGEYQDSKIVSAGISLCLLNSPLANSTRLFDAFT